MKYKATLGLTAKLTTAFVTILLTGIIFLIGYYSNMPDSPIPSRLTGIVVIAFIAALYVWAYLHSPKGYVITDQGIIVRRPHKDVTIPLSKIKAAFIINKETMGAMEKNGGNAGLFGFFWRVQNYFRSNDLVRNTA